MSQILRGPVTVRSASSLGSGSSTNTTGIAAHGARQTAFHIRGTNTTPLATVTLEISTDDGANWEAATITQHGIVLIGTATGVDLSPSGAFLYAVLNDARMQGLPTGLLRLAIANTAAILTGFFVNAYVISEVERLSTR